MTSSDALKPPIQTYFLPGNLLDLRICPEDILKAFATDTATLKQISTFAHALNDCTTCLRWLLNNHDTPKAKELMNEFTIEELRTEAP